MKYYLCEICGNLVELIKIGGGELVCCGEPMKELVPKLKEEGNEKHLPVIIREGSKVIVKIGSIEHPMTKEHYIEWVSIFYNNKHQRIKLDPTSKPEVTFDVEDFKTMEIYSYCNIHGLWKTTIENK